MGTMSRLSKDLPEALTLHPLQYAHVLHTVAYPHDPLLVGTESMTDEQVFAALADRGKDSMGRELTGQVRHQLAHSKPYMLMTERYNRCIACEEWSPCRAREAAEAAAAVVGTDRRRS
jgi:hypothetical protein